MIRGSFRGEEGGMTVQVMTRRPAIGRTAAWLETPQISAIVGVSAFVVMTVLGAYIRIPLPWTPVPVTLQTFFVLLAGATLGPALGSLSQAIYLLLGIIGLPVFAGGAGGLTYLATGATAGYLVGFMPAAALVGWLVRRRQRPGTAWVLCCLASGDLTLQAFGVVWLAWSLHIGFTSAIGIGLVPFLAGDALKVCAAAGLFRKFQRRAWGVLP